MKLVGMHTQEVAERIVEAFKHPERLPQALAPIFIHRNDDVPCRKWSWHNRFLVALSGTTDARGIRQWRQVGRHPKKGSKALWILAPLVKTVTEKNEEGEEVSHSILYGFRSVPVFRVEDTEGEPLPESEDKYEEWVKALPLLEVAESWGIRVGAYSHSANAPLGYYAPTAQAIELGVENLSTWTHELIHAADHRLPGSPSGRISGEIVAEFGGAILLECLGMPSDADLGGAYDYIQRYARKESKPVVKACIDLLERVCRCVDLVLETAEDCRTTAADSQAASPPMEAKILCEVESEQKVCNV